MGRSQLLLAFFVAAPTLALPACGGGGGGGGKAVFVAPAVTLDFPPTGCVTDAPVTARGRTAGIAGIQSVRVGGRPASSTDAFRTFDVVTNGNLGDEQLVAEAVRTDGLQFQSEPVTIRREAPIFGFAIGLAYDEVEDRVIFSDQATDALLAFDRASKQRVRLTQPARLEPLQGIITKALAYDTLRGRTLALERFFDFLTTTEQIVAIDEGDGTRTVVTSRTVGTGPQLELCDELAWHASTDRLLVVDQFGDAIVDVDPVTGDRSIVSSDSVGTGPALGSPIGITIDAPGEQAFVIDSGLRAVLVVDLASGDRKILSDRDHGQGIDLLGPSDVVLDDANDRLLVFDSFNHAVIGVALKDGDRSVVVVASSGAPVDEFNVSLVLEPSSGLLYFNSGRSMFEIDVKNNEARELFDPVLVGDGQGFDSPGCVMHDPETGDLLVIDGDPQLLIRVDSRSGDRSVVSDPITNSGPSFSLSSDAAFDASARRVLALNSFIEQVVAIDLATGDRSEVSGPSRGSGPVLDSLFGIEIDAARGRCFVSMTGIVSPGIFETVLLSVDLATGDRTLVSGAGRGAGPVFSFGFVTYDPARDELIAASSAPLALYRIDVATGDRSILSDASTDSDPPLASPRAIELAPDGRRAFYVDQLGGPLIAMCAVDLATGDRAVVSDCNGAAVGTGPAFSCFTRFGIDAEHGVAFLFEHTYDSIAAIDLETGDRMIRSR